MEGLVEGVGCIGGVEGIGCVWKEIAKRRAQSSSGTLGAPPGAPL